MRLLAPAKINLHLRVGPPRNDGFHPLLTWMTTIGLFDILEIERRSGGRMGLECEVPGVPKDGRNLVVRAAVALADSMVKRSPSPGGDTATDFGLAMRLHKRIPSGAGLGGGSSDGARTLLGLNVLWNAGQDLDDLSRLAGALGSDLPFFFGASSAICTGRGEIVSPVPPPNAKFALLAMHEISLPTPEVYKRFDVLDLGRQAAIECVPDLLAWSKLGADELLPVLVNDLEPAAFSLCPALGEIRRALEQKIGRIVRMSGSGSCLFSLFDSEAEARLVAEIGRMDGLSTAVVEVGPEFQDDLNMAGGSR